MPEDHGAGKRAVQDGRHLHRAEDPIRRGGPELHLRHRRAMLRGGHRAGRDGHDARGAAVGEAPEAHHQVLPAPVGQPAGA